MASSIQGLPCQICYHLQIVLVPGCHALILLTQRVSLLHLKPQLNHWQLSESCLDLSLDGILLMPGRLLKHVNPRPN